MFSIYSILGCVTIIHVCITMVFPSSMINLVNVFVKETIFTKGIVNLPLTEAWRQLRPSDACSYQDEVVKLPRKQDVVLNNLVVSMCVHLSTERCSTKFVVLLSNHIRAYVLFNLSKPDNQNKSETQKLFRVGTKRRFEEQTYLKN